MSGKSKADSPKLLVAGVVIASLLSGCAWAPGLNVKVDRGAEPADDGYRVFSIDGDLIRQQAPYRHDAGTTLDSLVLNEPLMPDDYRIGPSDVLSVIVWRQPELTNPLGEFRDESKAGRLVRADGSIFYPYIGTVEVSGKTVEQVRGEISKRLSRFVRDPQVDVRVAAFRAHQAYVTGHVNNPGIQSITDRPLSVLDAINQAGGFAEDADQLQATLTRNGREYPIDLYALYVNGDARNNVILRGDDVLHVQNDYRNKVFVLGAVNQQASLPMDKGRMSLAEALGQAEGLDASAANDAGVYVVRGGDQTGQSKVFTLNMSRMDSMLLADRFMLHPRDVVYVSATGLSKFATVMQQLTPTISTIFQADTIVDRRR